MQQYRKRAFIPIEYTYRQRVRPHCDLWILAVDARSHTRQSGRVLCVAHGCLSGVLFPLIVVFNQIYKLNVNVI